MKKWLLAILSFSLLMVLVACSDKQEKEQEGVKIPKNEQEEAKDILTVYTAGPTGLAEKIEETFEAETGLQVEVFQGTTGKVLARLEAEKNNPLADVVILASLPAMEGLKEDGKLAAYENVENKKLLIKQWSDSEDYYFGYSASALGLVYNTSNVSNPPKEWSELGEEIWTDRIAIPDPSQSGSALDFLYGYTEAIDTAWTTIEQWKENGLTLSGANKEALETVITGAKDVVIAGVDYMTYAAKAKGEPVDVYYPESGTVISPRPAAILSDAPNRLGAEQFIDFLLSETGQQLVVDAYLLPGIEGVEVSNRVPFSDIPILDFDWKDNETKVLDILDIFN